MLQRFHTLGMLLELKKLKILEGSVSRDYNFLSHFYLFLFVRRIFYFRT